MTTTISSANFLALKGLPEDELNYSQDVQLGTKVYSDLLGKKITSASLIKALESNNFYSPSLIIKENGFFINWEGETVKLAKPFNFSELTVDAKEKKKRFLTCIAGEEQGLNFAVRYELLESCTLSTKDFVRLIDEDNPEKTAQFILTVIIPPSVTSLPDGLYEVKKVEIKEKSGKIHTTEGSSIIVAKNIPSEIEFVKFVNGFCYTSDAEGRCYQGISMIMNCIPLPFAEDHGAAECEVGSIYQIMGVAEGNYEGTPTYNAVVKCMRSNTILNIRADKSYPAGFLISASLGKDRFMKVTKIEQPSGNMKYPRVQKDWFNPKPQTNSDDKISVETTSEESTTEIVAIETTKKKSKAAA
jgi:hypothetical protein